MKNHNKCLLFFILVIFCFTDCKKYEEGPWISLRTKRARVTGTYEVELYKVNDIDSTFLFASKNYDIVYDKEYPNTMIFGASCINSQGNPADHMGIWEFLNKGKDFQVGIAICPHDDNPFVISNGQLTWRILRLTNKEFWIETDYQSNHYIVKLKKIKDI